MLARLRMHPVEAPTLLAAPAAAPVPAALPACPPACLAQAAPDSRRYMENAYIPQSAWMMTHTSPGMALALLKDGGAWWRLGRGVWELGAGGPVAGWLVGC